MNKFPLSPELGMTDEAQSLLMHDALEIDNATPSNSQHSDQSFELFDFSPPPALVMHECSEIKIDVDECLAGFSEKPSGGGRSTAASSVGVDRAALATV